MPEPLSLLIVDSDPLRRQAVRDLLKEIDTVRVEAEAADHEIGRHLTEQLKPGIVISELGNPPDAGLSAVEQFLVASPKSAIFVCADSHRGDMVLRAMRAGAQEFLVTPIGKEELSAAIQRIARQRAFSAVETTAKGKVITLFGAKGGRGTTVVALNLAVALAKRSEGPVVAVDLDLQAGDLSLHFSLKPSYTIHDAIVNMNRIDPLFLKSLLCEHPSGVSLLAAPNKIEEADHVQPLQISQLLSLLKASCAYIVVDTSPTYDERSLSAFDAADELLIVATPDFSSLYHTRRCLALFERLAYNPEKVKILLNRGPAPLGKAVKMAQEMLDRPIFWEFPEDEAVVTSLTVGEPLTCSGKSSMLTARFMTLAEQLVKNGHAVTQPGNIISSLAWYMPFVSRIGLSSIVNSQKGSPRR